MPKALKQILRRLRADRPVRRRGHFEIRPIEFLETRTLPSAVVSFTGSQLTITGDAGPNVITVENVAGQLHIDANGGTIIVAGSPVSDFTFGLSGAFNLTATFQDADDALIVTGPLSLKSVNVKMGEAPLGDTVVISDASLSGKLTIETKTGADTVVVSTTNVAGATLINTGDNDDTVVFSLGTFTGATTINTGIGIDTVVLAGGVGRIKFVGKLTVTTGDDIDTVVMALADTKAFSIDTGDDVDVVVISDVLVNGGITVKTGSEIDSLIVDQVIQSGTGAVLFDTGSGADVLVLSSSSLTGAVTVNLGSGTGNVALIDDTTFNGLFTLNTQGTTDAIVIEGDTGLSGSTTFKKAAKFNLGLATTVLLGTADPNSLTTFLASATFTGKTPVSTLVVTVANVSFFSPPVLTKVTRFDV
jgi:hypothetical protein